MPTALPGDNQLKGFQWRRARARQEESGFSGSRGPPQASGCMTVLSPTHDSKRWDKSLCSVHAVPLDSSRGGDEGLIKILQINYTKEKKKKANYLYTKSVQGLHFAVIICTNSAGGGEKEAALVRRRGRIGRGSGERAHLRS